MPRFPPRSSSGWPRDRRSGDGRLRRDPRARRAADERDDRLARLRRWGGSSSPTCAAACATAARPRCSPRAPSLHERMLENATRQIVAAGGRDLLAMQRARARRRRSRAARSTTCTPRTSSPPRADAARKRSGARASSTRVLGAGADPKRRLFAVIDALDAWVASDRFRADQSAVRAAVVHAGGCRTTTCASISPRSTGSRRRSAPPRGSRRRPSSAPSSRRASPARPAWFDRRAAARAAGVGVRRARARAAALTRAHATRSRGSARQRAHVR